MKSNKAFFLLLILLAFTSCNRSSSERIQQYTQSEQRVVEEAPWIEARKADESEIKAQTSHGQIKVALLLPLSGKNQKLGQAMLDAAHLAIADLGNKNITIVSIDTSDTDIGAIQGMNKAVNERVSLVVGPVFSSATARIVDQARNNNINLISFSNDKSLLGRGVFLLGFMPEQQIQKVLEYSLNRGLRSFSAYVPANDYGRASTATFTNFLRSQGVEPIKIANYPAANNQEKIDVSSIVDLSSSSDAIFVPEAGARLKQIAETISNNNPGKKVKLIGSGQWDDYSTMAIKELNGSFFATSSIMKRKQFEDRFNQVYGYIPPRITSLAYDAMALASYLARKDGGGDFSREAILNPRGFVSSNGIFRFRPDGSTERGLSIVEVNEIGFKELVPAPTGF